MDKHPLELTVLGMCFELALTNLLRADVTVGKAVLLLAPTRAYGIGPSGSGIVPIGLAVGATGFLRERSGRTPTRPVHRAIIRSFFWFSVSPFLLGRVKR